MKKVSVYDYYFEKKLEISQKGEGMSGNNCHFSITFSLWTSFAFVGREFVLSLTCDDCKQFTVTYELIG